MCVCQVLHDFAVTRTERQPPGSLWSSEDGAVIRAEGTGGLLPERIVVDGSKQKQQQQQPVGMVATKLQQEPSAAGTVAGTRIFGSDAATSDDQVRPRT